jgi:hypothetical protein
VALEPVRAGTADAVDEGMRVAVCLVAMVGALGCAPRLPAPRPPAVVTALAAPVTPPPPAAEDAASPEPPSPPPSRRGSTW